MGPVSQLEIHFGVTVATCCQRKSNRLRNLDFCNGIQESEHIQSINNDPSHKDESLVCIGSLCHNHLLIYDVHEF